MIAKIKIFFPGIKPLKFCSIILISFFYGLSTIVTIYIVSTLVSIISGAQTLELSSPLMLLTDLLKNNFDLDDKLSHITIGICSLTFMVILGFTKIYYIAKTIANARQELSENILKKSLNINSVFKRLII